jgi:ATP-dependent protease Clp ATPase subunit
MLGEEDLFQILKNPNNPVLLGKKEDFRSYGIDIRVEDESLRLLAENADKEKTGARGLVSVIEKVLLPFEKSLPSTGIRHFLVDRDVVLDPQASLRRKLDHPEDPVDRAAYESVLEEEKASLLSKLHDGKRQYIDEYPQVFSPKRIELLAKFHLTSGLPLESIMEDLILLHDEIKMFETDFFARYGLEINFDEEALDEILEQALERNTSATTICSEISRDFDYGLKLVSERTGQMKFTLPRRAVQEHDVFLDELIRESYGRYPINPSDTRKEHR